MQVNPTTFVAILTNCVIVDIKYIKREKAIINRCHYCGGQALWLLITIIINLYCLTLTPPRHIEMDPPCPVRTAVHFVCSSKEADLPAF